MVVIFTLILSFFKLDFWHWFIVFSINQPKVIIAIKAKNLVLTKGFECGIVIIKCMDKKNYPNK